MAITVYRTDKRHVVSGQNSRIVEEGYFTWTTTNTTAALPTTLRLVLAATFTPVGVASGDVTSILSTPTAKGELVVSGGTLSLTRNTASSSGMGVLYSLQGY